VAASRWQGVAGVLTRATGRAPGKAVEGQSSPEQRVATRREGTGRERGGPRHGAKNMTDYGPRPLGASGGAVA
jgi:hypothetical protein